MDYADGGMLIFFPRKFFSFFKKIDILFGVNFDFWKLGSVNCGVWQVDAKGSVKGGETSVKKDFQSSSNVQVKLNFISRRFLFHIIYVLLFIDLNLYVRYIILFGKIWYEPCRFLIKDLSHKELSMQILK